MFELKVYYFDKDLKIFQKHIFILIKILHL